MYKGDSETKWPIGLFNDDRVTERWDESKSAGRWFLTNLKSLHPALGGDDKFPQQVDALWDSYILFDRNARWQQAPTGLLSWGYTIMRTREKLAEDFRFAVGDGK